MLYSKSEKYLYSEQDRIDTGDLYDYATCKDSKKGKKVIHFPFVTDTEFQTYTPKWSETLDRLGLGSLTISTQIKGLGGSPARLYLHPEMLETDLPLHWKVWTGHSVFVQYLNDEGLNVSLSRCQTKTEKTYKRKLDKIRVFRVVIYAHFAIADFYRIFTGELRQDVLYLSRKKGKQGSRIEQKRRLLTQSRYKNKGNEIVTDTIKTEYFITVDGLDYALELCCIDSGAVHGATSLKDLAANTGTPLDYKDLLTSEDKSDMVTVYRDRPTMFFDYAMGDLAVYDCLLNNSNLMKQVYESLGLGDYFRPPKLTIGSTVAGLLTSAIVKRFECGDTLDGKEIREIVDRYCKGASAKEIVKSNNWSGLNAKVLGGRCFNNRPTHTIDEGLICDIDIAGAYATAMLNCDYPLGNPVVFGEAYRLNSDNQYISLREFLRQYRKNLVPGLYQIWFTLTEKLTTGQDFFNSYFPPKNWSDILDDEDEETNWLDRPDSTKIFSHEITNGLLTSDGLEWLERVCSRKLKNHILDHSEVKTAMFYDAKLRVDSIGELSLIMDEHVGQNTSDYSNGVTTNVDRSCKYWTSINLGELIISDLLKNRKYWKQVTLGYKELKRVDGKFESLTSEGLKRVETALNVGKYIDRETFTGEALTLKKHPLDTLYKLCCNTVYGDVVSKYFDVSNVIVGNNITAKIRALVWYLEKGLYTHGSITDGGVFNVNTVCFPKSNNRKLNDNTTQIYKLSGRELNQDKHINLRPLGSYNSIVWGEGETVIFNSPEKTVTLSISEALETIDKLASEHLKNLFNVSVVSLFSFESKGLMSSAVFRGQSDYGLYGGKHESYKPGKSSAYAMRAYPSRTGLPQKFLDSIHDNPKNIKRPDLFYKSQILKVGQYRQQYNSRFKNSVFVIGDSYHVVGLFREFSLSQFTFKTSEQRQSWESEVNRLKRKYGQSYEMYFTIDYHLEYQRMIEEIDRAISEGHKTFNEYIDEYYNRARLTHPYYENYLKESDRLYSLGVRNEVIDHDDFDFLGNLEISQETRLENWIDEVNREYETLTQKGIVLTSEDADLLDW